MMRTKATIDKRMRRKSAGMEENMKLSFRWYGEDDKVTLENIRQIPGMHSIVTAVYDVPVGEVWSEESIAESEKAGGGRRTSF